MRVVVDTNVFVSACLGEGASNAMIAAGLQRRYVPLMGAALLVEYEDVMGRADLFRISRLAQRERDELLDIFLANCEWTRVYYLWRPNVRDEADNHLVELAIAGGAECLVTNNLRDLRSMELRFPSLRVLAPGAFMKEI